MHPILSQISRGICYSICDMFEQRIERYCMWSECGHFQFHMQCWWLDWIGSDRINNCFRYQPIIANHKDYHLTFHSWSRDANIYNKQSEEHFIFFSSSEHKGHPNCVKCWTYHGLTRVGDIVHAHHNPQKLVSYKGLELTIQDPQYLNM